HRASRSRTAHRAGERAGRRCEIRIGGSGAAATRPLSPARGAAKAIWRQNWRQFALASPRARGGWGGSTRGASGAALVVPRPSAGCTGVVRALVPWLRAEMRWRWRRQLALALLIGFAGGAILAGVG